MSDNDAVLAEMLQESLNSEIEYVRDDFASKAMERLLSPDVGAEIYHNPEMADKLAATCYAIADAMMKARYVEPIKVSFLPEVH